MQNESWIKIYKVNCIITIVVGFMSVLASSTVTQGPWILLLDILVWPWDGNPATFEGNSFVLNAVLGGMMMSLGTMMYLLAPKLLNDPEIKTILVKSILVWFVFDSMGSYASGIYGNIVLNIIFLGLLLGPVSKISFAKE